MTLLIELRELNINLESTDWVRRVDALYRSSAPLEIEQMARAICRAGYVDPDRTVSDPQTVGSWAAWRDYVPQAIAAIVMADRLRNI